MSSKDIAQAAEQARGLLRHRTEVESVGVSRDKDGDLCVRVDVGPGTDKAGIRSLLKQVDAPVVVRSVSGRLIAH